MDEVVEAFVEADWAATDVREAYSEEFVIILVLVATVVDTVSRPVIDLAKVSVSVTVVKPDGAAAVTSGAVAEGSGVTPVAAID